MNLPSDPRIVRVTVEKPTSTKDGAGGKTTTYAAIRGTWLVKQTLHSYQSLQRLEQGAHNTQGPGTETRTLQLFVFMPPYPPGLKRDWRIVSPDGGKYRVLFTRPYVENLQVDAEIVA